MSIFDPSVITSRLTFEITTTCNHKCAHCYNVWNAKKGDPPQDYAQGVLLTDQYLAMMEKAVAQSQAEEITITGGEPFLHNDALKIITKACSLVSAVQIVTNGSKLHSNMVKNLSSAGVRSVQLTLLGATKTKHDELKGTASFDETVRAVLDLKEEGIIPQICCVPQAEKCRFVIANWNTHYFDFF